MFVFCHQLFTVVDATLSYAAAVRMWAFSFASDGSSCKYHAELYAFVHFSVEFNSNALRRNTKRCLMVAAMKLLLLPQPLPLMPSPNLKNAFGLARTVSNYKILTQRIDWWISWWMFGNDCFYYLHNFSIWKLNKFFILFLTVCLFLFTLYFIDFTELFFASTIAIGFSRQ